MHIDSGILDWLLQGDVSIQYQAYRDLLGEERPDLQARISEQGWGARFLSKQLPNGHWGREFYQPKWTSTHYTLLDLKTLQASPDHQAIQTSVEMIATENKGQDGGINPGKTIKESDVCVNGMFLNYACYFGLNQSHLNSIIDFILSQQLPDGGFNCQYNRQGARHGSMHSTISLLEGMWEYESNGYDYRIEELKSAAAAAREFLLIHRLYKSDHSGEIIHKNFLRLSFPGRWYYDILRALDHFQDARVSWDRRMSDAVDVLWSKRKTDGRWPLQAKIPGKQHFEMEVPGKPSRWNTLRAMRVLKRYKVQDIRKKSRAN
ncbi:MAG: hypothetical protein PVF85_03785 [Anaerolineales bacterium]|jgi:hypothetical protein